jgi:Arc/MetJ family transcription regulator
MRTTVTIDDSLLDAASKWTGIQNKSDLINKALKLLVDQELLDRFLALEGTMPDLAYPERSYRSGRENLSGTMLNETHG